MAPWPPLVVALSLFSLIACDSGKSSTGPDPVPARVDQVGGGPATTTVGSTVPVSVRVTDSRGQPSVGAPLTWRVITGGGLLSGAAATGADGAAAGSWVLGTTAGTQTIGVTVAPLAEVVFSATAVAGALETIALSPSSPTLSPDDTLTLTAQPRDAYGNAKSGVTLQWSVSDPRVALISSGGQGEDGHGDADGLGRAGAPLQQCATDPLATRMSSLRADVLVFTGPGVVTLLYLITPNLDLKVFYCGPGTVLVAPLRSLRLHCA